MSIGMSNPIDQKVMSLPGASIKPPKPLLIEENMASKRQSGNSGGGSSTGMQQQPNWTANHLKFKQQRCSAVLVKTAFG